MHPYQWLKIERRRDGRFYVLDKRGPNVEQTGPFASFTDAQAAWSRIAATARQRGLHCG